MPKTKISVLLAAILLLCGMSAGAQQLSELGRDPAIRIGSLPDGIRYYLVTNAAVKGRADYALVRKNYGDSAASRAAIGKLPTYPDINPCQLLADKGVGYSADGCISYRDEGSVIHFHDVPVFDESVADSTLLVIFDLIRTADCPQTIVISGDIKGDKLADRMYMLSMTVPMLPANRQKAGAPEWKADSDLKFDIKPFGRDGLAEINMTVEAPRTQANLMNTAVPIVTGRFAALLKDILETRIVKAFKEKNLPVGKIDLIHEDSAARSGNEIYTISVVTEEKTAADAAGILSGIVDGIICKGADISEFKSASARLASEASGRKTTVTNSEYVEKCICAELYGASPAPASATDKYFAFSRLSPEKELPLFNNYVYALLDPEGLKTRAVDSTAITINRIDSTAFASIIGKAKTKLSSTTPEPITGGELWTFSNGMKVIFKKENTPGRFEYGLMIKGGAPVAPEILWSFDIAGISGNTFRKILQDNGVTMDCHISESDLRLSGAGPSSKLQLLLNALCSLSGNRKFNSPDYDYRMACTAIKRRMEGFKPDEMLEDMMCPDYEYTAVQIADSLNARLPQRAGKYFSSQFSRMNDGVMVIVGDFDASALQKTLIKSLPAFKCGKATSVRPRIRHDIRQGWYTRMRTGETCAAMSITFSNPFSLDGYMAFRLASTALRRSIVRELAAQGMYADFIEDVEFFPNETYTVIAVCRPCATDGLPESIKKQSAVDAMNALRRAVNGLSTTSISDKTLKACKAELESKISSDCSAPSFLVDAAMTRYSVGRDILSSWKTSIGKVSAADVSAILKKMENGARMEIISK